jgi:hypothetical protein
MFGFQSFPAPRSYIALEAGNGYGAVSVKVRRYQTTNSNVGSSITYADDPNTGAQFTINQDGIYAMGRADQTASVANFGFSLNASASGATGIQLLAWPGRIIYSQVASSAVGFVTSTLFLPAGSVVRPHDDGACTTNGSAAQLFITQVSP